MPRTSIFPLHTVLFPSCTLPLQIFEQRYLSMIKESFKKDQSFITALILKGKEVNDRPTIVQTGSYVNIIDWQSLDNGLLGITIQCESRVTVSNIRVNHDGLFTGNYTLLPEPENNAAILKNHVGLIETLKQLLQHPFAQQQNISVDYNDTNDVFNKLSQLLPVDNTTRQHLLELTALEKRFDYLSSLINELQN